MKSKKIVDVKGPAVWGCVSAKRGDRLKVYAYPKNSDGETGGGVGVGRRCLRDRPKGSTKMVDIRLTRKDAKNLYRMMDVFYMPGQCGKPWFWDTKQHVINKLKRAGIKRAGIK